MKVTPSNYTEVCESVCVFLKDQIQEYINIAGSKEKLSLKLGHAENYIRLTLSRHENNYGTLDRIWKECRKKMGTLDAIMKEKK